MTPLGEHLRDLRLQRNITQKDMAAAIGVSAAYLSALEHGRRGKPSWALLQRIVGFLNVIWDDAEKLQQLAVLSDPKVSIDTINLSANATKAANLLAAHISELSDLQLQEISKIIKQAASQ